MSNKPVHILLIDDDEDENIFFQEALKNLELTLIYNYANNLDAALRKLESQNPDYIFIDLNMPKQNGFECIKKIRDHGSFNNCMIILYSTGLNKEACRKAISIGANGCLKKTNPEILINDLQRIFFSNGGTINFN